LPEQDFYGFQFNPMKTKKSAPKLSALRKSLQAQSLSHATLRHLKGGDGSLLEPFVVDTDRPGG
jgi:hypothetical protein